MQKRNSLKNKFFASLMTAFLIITGVSVIVNTQIYDVSYADTKTKKPKKSKTSKNKKKKNKKKNKATELKTKECFGVKTSIISCKESAKDNKEGEAVFKILAIVINILTYGVGIAATVGVVISGYQYMTSRDNPSAVAESKKRLVEIVIGLFAYSVLWGILQLLLPGGVYGK